MMFIAVDFDGTCVTNDFPGIGREIGAAEVLRELAAQGHKLILLTNRADRPLTEAVAWFNGHGIPLYGVNRNPVQFRFSRSPKVFANLYIDDAAVGCPLLFDENGSDKPYVDWNAVREILVNRGVIG